MSNVFFFFLILGLSLVSFNTSVLVVGSQIQTMNGAENEVKYLRLGLGVIRVKG